MFSIWLLVRCVSCCALHSPIHLTIKQIYQINATSIQVLDPSDSTPIKPVIREGSGDMQSTETDVSDLTSDEQGSAASVGPFDFASLLDNQAEKKKVMLKRPLPADDVEMEDIPPESSSKAAGKKRSKRGKTLIHVYFLFSSHYSLNGVRCASPTMSFRLFVRSRKHGLCFHILVVFILLSVSAHNTQTPME
jgi:hypothetical protein